MQAFAKILTSLALAAFLTSGCSSTSISNLTARQLPRNPNGLYLVEAEWRSNQASISKDTIKPKVVIGLEEYPMRRTLMLTNRWEALIPVASEKSIVHYKYKFDFNYSDFNGVHPDNRLSAPFQLEITDK